MGYKEAYSKFVSKNKQSEEKYSFLDSGFFRPLSIFVTIPISKTKLTPTAITKISIVCSFIGFFFLVFGRTMPLKLIGYLGYFLWVILDEVDGNIARYKNQCSALGDLWDTMGGYIAMILIYFGAGIAAYFDEAPLNIFESYWGLILGGATALFSIFPRLVMHKKKSSVGDTKAVKAVSDKQSFGLINILGMNLVSPTGLLQLFFFVSICTHTLNLFVAIYAVINFGIMIVSLRGLLKE